MHRPDGNVALVSGAARGIGAAIAEALAHNGAKVVVGDLLDEEGRPRGSRSRPGCRGRRPRTGAAARHAAHQPGLLLDVAGFQRMPGRCASARLSLGSSAVDRLVEPEALTKHVWPDSQEWWQRHR